MKLLTAMMMLLLVLAGTATAQEEVTALNWHLGFPTGRMADFTNETSFSGFGFEFRKFVNREVSIGGSFSWNLWSELTDEVIPFGKGDVTGAVSGTQIRYINAFPMYLNAHYYFAEKGSDFRPYAGLNAGVNYIRQRLEIGVWAFDNDNWHFAMAPEFGFLLDVSREGTINASARYNYAFDSGKTLGGKDDNSFTYWGVQIGFAWRTGWF
jgi:outer membrane protein W